MASMGLSSFLGVGAQANAPLTYAQAQWMGGNQIQGVNATASVSASLLAAPSGSVATGVSATLGGGAYGANSSAQLGTLASVAAPSQTTANVNQVWGASVSLGRNLSITNASDNSQLSGDSHVQEVAIGPLNIQWSTGTAADGTPIKTLSLGLGLGLGYAAYDTTTAASSSANVINPAK